jgi:Predicted membrane protein (DUF2306)
MTYAHRLERPLNIVVGVLAAIGLGAAAVHYFIPPASPGFLIYPLAVALHVVSVGIWVTLAPWQFVKRIRSRWLDYHRWTGRLLVAVGLVVGGSALFMGWVIPIAGWAERVMIAFFGVFFLVALGKGYLAIRARQPRVHREWMIRAFALSLAVVTVRLIELPVIFTVGPQSLQVVYVIANTTAFTLHALIAEAWIRRTRRKRAPAGRGASRAESGTDRPARADASPLLR